MMHSDASHCSPFRLLAAAMLTVGIAAHSAHSQDRGPSVGPSFPASPNETFSIRGPIMLPDPSVPTPAFLGVFADAEAAIPVDLTFGPFDTDPFVIEDAFFDDEPGMPMRIGVGRSLPGDAVIDAAHDGQWEMMPDGTRVWSFSLRVPGASAVRVHLPDIFLPVGSQLLVNGENDIIDVYDAMSPADLWTMAVPGGAIRFQYQAPPEVAELPSITINGISHIYRVLGAEPAMNPELGGLLPCHQDVMCHSPDVIARDSVATMDYVIGGSTFLCSGGLLNDLDDNTARGLVLTAHHCISTAAAANSATIYWFYQRNGCGGPIPNILSLPRSNGAALLATSSNTDFTLMRTLNDPASGQGFAGWTTLPTPSGAPITGIHHPGGSWKRISFGNLTTSQPICGSLPTIRYWYLKWNQGTTESGSSGSPLFNDNWQVIGQLFGTCGTYGGCTQTHNNVYGRFNATWSSISAIMTLITPDDEYEPNDTIDEAALLAPGEYDLILVDFDDWFKVEITEPSILTAAAAKDDAGSMATRLFLKNESGTAFVSNFINSQVQTVSSPVSPGTTYIHYQKWQGWGGDYTLTITLDPDCNENGIADHIDIANGTSEDVNGNGIPDECEDLGPDCLGDLNGDGVVNSSDLLELLNAWGPCPGCPEDLNDDGVVNSSDLLELLNAWGPCT